MQTEHLSVWERCLVLIKNNVEEQSFNTWFLPIKPVGLNGGALTIQVPSQFFYEWIEEHYVHILKEALIATIGTQAKLEYSVIVDQGTNNSSPYTVKLPNVNNYKSDKAKQIINPFEFDVLDRPSDSQLNKSYTFATYVEGDYNRLARSAGFAVAKKPGVTSFNPLLVYGGVGLGKTHLVQAIGNEIKSNLLDKFVLYVSSEKFISQFIKSVQNNEVQSFQSFYMQVDVLIIDDVQFFTRKEKTQEMFFHIFNHLHQSGKQIIMTSDRSPKDLKGFEERLSSRFKWGLTTDLSQPDFETRLAIIHNKMGAEGIIIPDEVIEYLAYTVDTNVRELEGVLISLIAHGSLIKREIDLELAKQIMKNIVHDIETEVGIDYIQKTVADYFHLTQDDLKARIRKKEIVIARQIAMYFSKEHTNHSLKSIGYHFGGRDHSTVIHAVQSVNDSMDVNASFKNDINELRNKLKIRNAKN